MLPFVLMLLLSSWSQAPSVAALPAFKAASIVSGLGMGYQVVLADLNRDKRLDVVVVDERAQDLSWYENPTWTRHVLATEVPRVINLDTHDLDGDGIPEIALAHRFETDPTRSVGQVLLLTHGDDPTQPWRFPPHRRRADGASRALDANQSGKAPWLIVAPFAGTGVLAPKYEGRTPIYAYRSDTWTRQQISSTLTGIVHSIHPVEWAPGRWQLLTASFDGLQRLVPKAASGHTCRSRPATSSHVPAVAAARSRSGRSVNDASWPRSNRSTAPTSSCTWIARQAGTASSSSGA